MKYGESIEIKKNDSRIEYLRPCASPKDKGKLQAKISLKEKFDPKWMCDELSKVFKNVRCSEKGAASFGWSGMAIMVFSNGQINIRGAENKEEVMRIKGMIEKILLKG